MIRNIRYGLLPAAVLVMAALASCEDDIEIGGTVDESIYESATQLSGMLLDENTNQNSSTVQMYDDQESASVVFRLSKQAGTTVSIQVAADESYATAYNAANETEYAVFPSANVQISNGSLSLAAGETVSSSIEVTLNAFSSMTEGETYILPLAVTTSTNGVTLTDESSHVVFLVQDCRGNADHNKGEDYVRTVVYFEVNDVNPLNALEFVTESGKYFFDDVVLFAGNINWDAENQRVYLANNENVQFLLDNNEEYLQPLRRAGMRVILSVLGNHDEAGVAQLSDMGAKEFARELAAYCEAYNLDGVGFDDEYSTDPDLDNPWLTTKSVEAASRLLYECKQAMPDKVVTVYSYGYLYSEDLVAVDGVEPGDYLDYSVADYGQASEPGPGMTLKQCSGMSIELNYNYFYPSWYGDASEETARANKEAGYGYYMFFALNPSLYNSRGQVISCQTVCKGLYDEELVAPSYYYSKNSTVRTAL